MNVTRAEAQARARLLDVEGYYVVLDLTIGDVTFGSTTTARFRCTEPGAETFVDLVADRVLALELNGVALDPGTAFDGFRVTLPALAGHNVFTVEADCRYSSTGEGLHRFVDPVDEQVYVYTQFEPFEAHRVFACFDKPDLKAPWTLTVRCPGTWLVVSTTTGVPSAEGDFTRWDFPGSAVVSTYLYALAAGPFARVRSEHGPIPMDVYCRATLAAHLDADAVLTVTRQGFDHFRELFGQPYPFGKYDQVFVPEFNSGAMENVACVLLTERILFRSRVTRTMAMRRAEILLHELAHMWFGNLVTMRWWDDLWLNESFATYVAAHHRRQHGARHHHRRQGGPRTVRGTDPPASDRGRGVPDAGREAGQFRVGDARPDRGHEPGARTTAGRSGRHRPGQRRRPDLRQGQARSPVVAPADQADRPPRRHPGPVGLLGSGLGHDP